MLPGALGPRREANDVTEAVLAKLEAEELEPETLCCISCGQWELLRRHPEDPEFVKRPNLLHGTCCPRGALTLTGKPIDLPPPRKQQQRARFQISLEQAWRPPPPSTPPGEEVALSDWVVPELQDEESPVAEAGSGQVPGDWFLTDGEEADWGGEPLQL